MPYLIRSFLSISTVEVHTQWCYTCYLCLYYDWGSHSVLLLLLSLLILRFGFTLSGVTVVISAYITIGVHTQWCYSCYLCLYYDWGSHSVMLLLLSLLILQLGFTLNGMTIMISSYTITKSRYCWLITHLDFTDLDLLEVLALWVLLSPSVLAHVS